MDTNPNQEVSETPEVEVEDRLAKAFGAGDEEDPQDEPLPEDDVETESKTDEPTPESDDEDVEFEGKAYKVPKELKPALLRTEDYTRKTQEVASMRKQVEDQALFLEARQHLLAEATQELADLRAAEQELEQYAKVDWVSEANNDAGRAFALSQRQKMLENRVGQLKFKLNQAAQHAEQIATQHRQKQLRLAVEGARQALGKVTDEDDKQAMKMVLDLGFTDADIHRLADPRILQMAFKAAKWDALQSAKPGVTKKAESARPMKAVARSAPQAQREGVTLQARQALKKTGSSNAAEAFFESLFKRK